jgi:hypothetical protein
MFNKVKWTGPEDRVCRYCGNGFRAIRATWRCNPCTLTKQKELNEKTKRPKKDFYPFDTANGEAKSRFRRIYRELNMCNTREELTQHYDKMFKEIEENGIMEWIIDRRDAETAEENKNKSIRRIRNEYPDTRQLNQD